MKWTGLERSGAHRRSSRPTLEGMVPMPERDATGLLVSMQGISKSFPGVQALIGVDFDLRAGEIHALMGGNGAGKSTLIKILTGVEKPETGRILLEGSEVVVRSPQQAQAMGISTVYQEINLCPNLTVAENILIGRQPTRFGTIDWRRMNREAREILLRVLGIDIEVTRTLGDYSVAIQQMVAIARSLEIESAKVLILDEPTSSLSSHETDQLFEVMRRLKGQQVGIVFITHFIDQVYRISDRVTVIRNGRRVGTFDTASLPRMDLVEKDVEDQGRHGGTDRGAARRHDPRARLERGSLPLGSDALPGRGPGPGRPGGLGSDRGRRPAVRAGIP
ncbi:MAG: Sugar ABC transporter ATP-binding protein [Anaerolineales bacterium]|nr:Sugar ABC transporter ATP-binding protein [Anaerolineales bacterium]